MYSIEQQIQNINDKVQQLLKKQQAFVKDNHRLQKENERLQQQITMRSEQINRLQQKNDAIKLNAGSMNDDVKKDLEKRITVYLKEIDNCLALLNA